jgi:hypothetical protein
MYRKRSISIEMHTGNTEKHLFVDACDENEMHIDIDACSDQKSISSYIPGIYS